MPKLSPCDGCQPDFLDPGEGTIRRGEPVDIAHFAGAEVVYPEAEMAIASVEHIQRVRAKAESAIASLPPQRTCWKGRPARQEPRARAYGVRR
ncbi:MAG: hypothetical protein ABEK42_02585 [Thiohalorhabdaceae bacterium]